MSWTLTYDGCGWRRPEPEPEPELERALHRAEGMAAEWARHVPAWMDREAFVSVARLAVLKAWREFRPGLGVSFRDYAAQCVHYALLDEMRRQEPVTQRRWGPLHRGEVERTPPEQPPVPWETLPEGGEPVDPGPGPEELALAHEGDRRLVAALSTLNWREEYVLTRRFIHGVTQQAVAQELEISRERVAQIEKAGKANLAARLRAGGWFT